MKIRFLLPAFLLLGACASSSDMDSLRMQVTDLQDEISQLRQQVSSKEDVQKLNERLNDQVQSMLKSTAATAAKVGEMEERLQNVQGSVEQTNYRMDRIAQQTTENAKAIETLESADVQSSAPSASSPQVPATPAAGRPSAGAIDVPSGPAGDPVQVYQTAYRDYQRGNYDLAIEGFGEFLQDNPKSDLADNAAYWIGESLFSQKKYREAIQQFDVVINSFTKSDKVPGALLKKGYSYVEIGQKAQGVVQMQYVIHEHPRSQEATLARQKLKSLGIQSN